MPKKRKVKSRLAQITIAVFALYIVMLLINNQISLNKARAQTEVLEQRNHQQELVNAGIKAQNELNSDSDKQRQYIIDTAHEKLHLVLPNEIMFYDTSH